MDNVTDKPPTGTSFINTYTGDFIKQKQKYFNEFHPVNDSTSTPPVFYLIWKFACDVAGATGNGVVVFVTFSDEARIKKDPTQVLIISSCINSLLFFLLHVWVQLNLWTIDAQLRVRGQDIGCEVKNNLNTYLLSCMLWHCALIAINRFTVIVSNHKVAVYLHESKICVPVLARTIPIATMLNPTSLQTCSDSSNLELKVFLFMLQIIIPAFAALVLHAYTLFRIHYILKFLVRLSGSDVKFVQPWVQLQYSTNKMFALVSVIASTQTVLSTLTIAGSNVNLTMSNAFQHTILCFIPAVFATMNSEITSIWRYDQRFMEVQVAVSNLPLSLTSKTSSKTSSPLQVFQFRPRRHSSDITVFAIEPLKSKSSITMLSQSLSPPVYRPTSTPQDKAEPTQEKQFEVVEKRSSSSV